MGWPSGICLLLFLNGFLALLRSIKDPQWYIQKRVAAGLDAAYDIRGMIIAKMLTLPMIALLAYWMGAKANYFWSPYNN